MLFQPRMRGAVKAEAFRKHFLGQFADRAQLKCCQVPKVSTNFTSTIFAPCFFASLNYTLWVCSLLFSFVV